MQTDCLEQSKRAKKMATFARVKLTKYNLRGLEDVCKEIEGHH